MPYDYIFNTNLRKKLKLYLKDKIIVMDEAHNSENKSVAAKSFKIDL